MASALFALAREGDEAPNNAWYIEEWDPKVDGFLTPAITHYMIYAPGNVLKATVYDEKLARLVCWAMTEEDNARRHVDV